MPYLDGEKVSKDKIIPGKCIFTGYFRPIDVEGEECPVCGQYWIASSAFEAQYYFDSCLKAGHLDEPVYKSV
jgi:hypothetical protein